jgi:DUF1680 family protein
MIIPTVSRRAALLGGAATVLCSTIPIRSFAQTTRKVEAFPLDRVRLTPSIWLDAVKANQRYLLSLEPDRLLHNFRTSAGLAAKGAVYGGWESRGIAGHSLGHYLSALALMHAQTGDMECRRRAEYIVAEMALCQQAHGDGYVGGTTVDRNGQTVDGKIIFEELRRGDIRSSGFDLNGGWVPIYTFHKVYAGLLDTHQLTGNAQALDVALRLADYFATIVEQLDDTQVQKILATEHGGINESFAETYSRTRNPRWLRIAGRLNHHAVLDPLARGEDSLAGLHANTQIPKIIGIARQHELTGDTVQAGATRFFWSAVTRDHSYVIGGNSEREHFGPPRALKLTLTDQTCEACNSYNMLKLTRHLYAWQPTAQWFDYYERTHLNHILSHQDPATGMFTYMTPLMAGSARRWSTPTDDFWCCVGSGMESHAKHGDSIYWRTGNTLLINLFIPSVLDWREKGLSVRLDSRFPADGKIRVTVTAAPERPVTIALRLPGWTSNPTLALNGATIPFVERDGYATVQRRWRPGDHLDLDLPMSLSVQSLPDAPDVVAFVSGPVVLAADLGDAAKPFDQPAPALVTNDVATALSRKGEHTYLTRGAGRPAAMTFQPFFQQYHRRSAVYLPKFTDAAWQIERASFEERQAAIALRAKHTADVIHLGEMQPERDHDLTSRESEPVSYMGRSGRLLRTGGEMSFNLAARPGALSLWLTEWERHNDNFDLIVEGKSILPTIVPAPRDKEFVETEYTLPQALARHSGKLHVQLRTRGWVSLYEIRLMDAPIGDQKT